MPRRRRRRPSAQGHHFTPLSTVALAQGLVPVDWRASVHPSCCSALTPWAPCFTLPPDPRRPRMSGLCRVQDAMRPAREPGAKPLGSFLCQALLRQPAIWKHSPKNLFIEQGQGKLSLWVRPPQAPSAWDCICPAPTHSLLPPTRELSAGTKDLGRRRCHGLLRLLFHGPKLLF